MRAQQRRWDETTGGSAASIEREYSFAKVGAASGQSIPGNWFQSLHGWNDP
jgi:hypothetical protein